MERRSIWNYVLFIFDIFNANNTDTVIIIVLIVQFFLFFVLYLLVYALYCMFFPVHSLFSSAYHDVVSFLVSCLRFCEIGCLLHSRNAVNTPACFSLNKSTIFPGGESRPRERSARLHRRPSVYPKCRPHRARAARFPSFLLVRMFVWLPFPP